VIVAVVGLHLIALHTHGSKQPARHRPQGAGRFDPFHPYYTIKDMFGLGVFLLLYAGLVFLCAGRPWPPGAITFRPTRW